FGAYFNSTAYLNYRSTTGGTTSQSSAPAGSLPYWLKLSRSGSTLRAYTSADGVNWTPIGAPQTINMGQNVYIGLALCSNNTSTLATATFDNVSVSSIVAPPPTYTLSASPSSLSIPQGTSGASTITVTPPYDLRGSDRLSASVQPSGVTASFSTNPATASSTLTLTASSTAPTLSLPVALPILATATFDSVSVSSIVAPPPTYTLSASPSSLSIPQGTSGASTITVTPQNGFSGSVSLSASGQPSGVTASFGTNPATASSTLTLTASSTATTGTFAVVVTGTSGNLTNSTTVSLTVTPGRTFPLSALPN